MFYRPLLDPTPKFFDSRTADGSSASVSGMGVLGIRRGGSISCARVVCHLRVPVLRYAVQRDAIWGDCQRMDVRALDLGWDSDRERVAPVFRDQAL